jgi:hypothetical protein
MKGIILLSVLFILSFINASYISPNPISVELNVNQNMSYTLTINNTNNFSIFDFKFPTLESKGFHFPDITIPGNTALSFPFYVITNESFYGIINEKVEFNFYANLPEEITNYYIDITDNGFSETYKTIRKGDTIIWTNKDDVTHTIYSTEFGSLTIAENSTAQYTFNNLGKFSYYDEYFYIFSKFNGEIEVINRTAQQKVHNPMYDIPWDIDLTSVANPTNLQVSNSKNNFTIVYNSYTNGQITIENIGDEDAEGVSIKSDSEWLTFEKTDFKIEQGQTDWVEYQIFPHSLQTNDTDKNYTIIIQVKAKNSNQTNLSINVYIPYKEITSSLDSDLAFLQYLENIYCPKYPCSKFCSPELPQCNYNSSYGDLNLEILGNISKIDLYNVMKDISKLASSGARTDNSVKELADLYGITVPELTELINQSVNKQIINEKKVKSNNNTVWIITSLILLLVGLIFMINRISKKKEMISRVGDPYKYKA